MPEDRLYLSRLVLNVRARDARRDLNDCVAMHRTLMNAFPDDLSSRGAARAEAGVLYRVEYVRLQTPIVEPRQGGQVISVLVQSALLPDWSRLPHLWVHPAAAPDTKDITEAIHGIRAGREFRFKLVANPTRKIGTKSSEEGHRNNGKRVELRGEQEWLAWLERKAGQSGFRLRAVRAVVQVPDVQASRDLRTTGIRKEPDGASSRLTFRGVAFEGHLEVTDPQFFLNSLRAGIGPGKAYGYGLLSLARGD